MGTLEILNVQGGDVKLTFNAKDGSEAIRAKRYIGEMMRVGFVLLVEIERDGDRAYERALGFDASKGEYIIADYEGQTNGRVPPQVDASLAEAGSPVEPPAPAPAKNGKVKGRPRKRVPMEEANATAVGPSAGG